MIKNNFYKQRGSIFTMVLFAIAGLFVTGLVGNYVLGAVRGNATTTQRTQSANLLTQAAYSILTESSDSDGDGIPESTAGTVTYGDGWQIPATSGAPKADAWGTAFRYCAWDNGTIQTGAGATNASTRFSGDNPGTQNSLVYAVISAGPDKIFQTTCANAKAGIVNGDDGARWVTVAQINQGVGGTVYFGDPVADATALAAVNTATIKVGQVRLVKSTGTLWQWNGATWTQAGGSSGGPSGTTWQMIWSTDVLSATSTVTATGLNGDVDQEYKIIVKLVSGYSGAEGLYVSLNGDGVGTDYVIYRMFGQGGAPIGDAFQAGGMFVAETGASGDALSEMLLYAKSGKPRFAITQLNGYSGTMIFTASSYWNNWYSNITSMTFNTGSIAPGSHFEIWAKSTAVGGSGTGQYWNANGNNIYNTNTSNVGVKTPNPGTDLDVAGGIRAGTTAQVATCNAAQDGVMRYNSATPGYEFCNGASSTWVGMGSGGYLSWKKIWSYDVTVATFDVWTGFILNGDVDGEYKIYAKIIPGSAAGTNVFAQPNGDGNSSNFWTEVLEGVSGVLTNVGSSGQTWTQGFLMQAGISTAGGCGGAAPGSSEMLVWTKTSPTIPRAWSATDIDPGGCGIAVQPMLIGGTWKNYTNNITSISFVADQTAGIGVGSHFEVWAPR